MKTGDTMKFTELKINELIKRSLGDIGFDEMMPIQEQAIPLILKGQNVIGEAETGTGKTAAFVLPLLEMVDFESGNIEALIVTPTRELAIQIVNEIEKLGKYLNPTYATLVGGMSIREQAKVLKKKPTIVVGTLGRINDHLRNRKLDLSKIKYFVLDEADEMLKEGFKEDITIINQRIPKSKQTLLFSATISKQILSLSKTIADDYKFISVKNEFKSSTNIDQYYIVMKEKHKFPNLTKLLDIHKPKSAIIFGRTKRRVDELNKALNKCGYESVGLHGDLSQQQRNAVMRKFRENQINILVATDVAARGLDISGVTHVYNFDLPQEIEFYIHRVGRTGRAKSHGVSYSFIKEQEIPHIKDIEKAAKVKILEKKIPTKGDVWSARNDEVKASIDKRLGKTDVTRTKDFATELIDQYGSEKLVSLLIESLSKKSDINEISLTGEPPVTVKRRNTNNRNNHKRKNKPNRGNKFNRRSHRRKRYQ